MVKHSNATELTLYKQLLGRKNVFIRRKVSNLTLHYCQSIETRIHYLLELLKQTLQYFAGIFFINSIHSTPIYHHEK